MGAKCTSKTPLLRVSRMGVEERLSYTGKEPSSTGIWAPSTAARVPQPCIRCPESSLSGTGSVVTWVGRRGRDALWGNDPSGGQIHFLPQSQSRGCRVVPSPILVSVSLLHGRTTIARIRLVLISGQPEHSESSSGKKLI